ncbi:MAG: metal-dependent phosphohydrolase [Fimbriimonadales bacterium]|nr:MAG: metal-dependent phosphohydrolase [Fimbriimonadales bacterium]
MTKRKRFWIWFYSLTGVSTVLLFWAGVPLLQQHSLAVFSGIVALALLAELLLIRLPLRPEYTDRGLWFSVSTPVVIATILTYGWQFGVWLDAMISLIAGLCTTQLKNTHPRWALVNTVQSVPSAGAAGLTVVALQGEPASPVELSTLMALLFALGAYMIVNALLVSVTMSIVEGVRVHWVLGQTVLSLPRDIALMTPISYLITAALVAYGAVGLVGVLAPYLALRQAFVIGARQQELYHQTIRSLGFLVQRAHPYTGGHLQRVSQWARRVAERLGLPPERCELIYEAALLHDLGKTVLDERILNKPSRLLPEEWEEIKKHPQLGAEILRDTPFIAPIIPWIAMHHERPDGTGYPFGLKGEQIPIEARIIAVVDAFDAMIGGEAPNQQRAHRRPLSIEKALDELERFAGTQFDPVVVQTFKQVVLDWQRRRAAGAKI